MPRYRIRPGQKHYLRTGRGSGIKAYNAGAVIELEEASAVAFMDKLELLSETPLEQEIREEYESRVEESKPDVIETGDGEFNVLNKETGEPINDNPLTQEEANDLSETLDESEEVKEEEKSNEEEIDEFLKDD